jgi:hypothetical protein
MEQTMTTSKRKPVKTQSVCEVYRYLKNNILECWKLSIQLLMDFEVLMPHKRLTKILRNRDEYFKLYPEELEKFKEQVKKDLTSK